MSKLMNAVKPDKNSLITISIMMVMMVGGILIAFYGDIKNELQRFSFIVLISLGTGVGATFLTGKITGEGKFGFLNIKSATGGSLFWVITFASFLYFFSKPLENANTTVLRKIPQKTSKLRVFVLKSGNYEYGNIILYSFLNTLRDSLKYTKYDLESPIIVTGNGDEYSNVSIRSDFQDKIRSVFSQEDYDYYITIGSAASKAFLDYARGHKSSKRHIFLGVTDPVALDLSNSISPNRDDPDHKEITGVAYCGNYEELPNKIHSIFPENKMCYIYNSAIIEDEHIATRFKEELGSMINQKTLEIKKVNRKPKLEDFSDANTVYFSWSTFDDIFVNDFSLISSIKRIVSTTSTHAKYGLVPIAVTTNDEVIGEQGAFLLLSNLLLHIPLEKLDIFVPKWQTYVNVRLAGKYDISSSAIQNCDIKY